MWRGQVTARAIENKTYDPMNDLWIKKLSDAIEKEQHLAYDEPPAWMIPVRQTLVALLLESRDDCAQEILQRIKEDYSKWPKNVWITAALMRYDEKFMISRDDKLLIDIKSEFGEQKATTSCACARKQWKDF